MTQAAPHVLPAAALEAALNACLRLDPETLTRIGALEGRCVELDLVGLPVTLYLLPGPDGMQVLTRFEGEPDTRLRGTPLALLRMSASREASRALFGGEVEFGGDVELGQRFKAILDGMEIDWEELLSRLTGDVLAHQLGNLARGLARWGSSSMDALSSDLGEYLQEERRLLPHPNAVRDYLDEVDKLRSDVDRLEARVRRLRRYLREGPPD